jgi:hypothetical protein
VDQAASDAAPLVPTATAADTAADPAAAEPGRVTAREIAEFLRHLAEFRSDARSDPGERAALLARKADLFTRIAADPTASSAPEGRTP